MEKIYDFKEIIVTFGGAVGGAIACMLGGWSHDLGTLITFMAIDYVLGFIVAAVFHKSTKTENGRLESNAGFKGFIKKCCMLLLVAVGYHLDTLIGTDYVRTAIIIGLILNELLSIIENVGLMGLPMPPVITEAIEILKKKADGGLKHD